MARLCSSVLLPVVMTHQLPRPPNGTSRGCSPWKPYPRIHCMLKHFRCVLATQAGAYVHGLLDDENNMHPSWSTERPCVPKRVWSSC